MKNISIIVAIAENNAIGKDNKLLCHISNDLKRFKKLTTGQTVIMGKNTYESLPFKPLPNRRNIVISDDRNDNFEGCIMSYSIDEAIENCSEEDENFVMGGASIYRQFLQYSNKLYITRVKKSFDADTFFPEIDYSQWKLIKMEAGSSKLEAGNSNIQQVAENNFDYHYETYIKL